MNSASRRGRSSALRYGRWLTWLIAGPLLVVFVSYVALPVGLSWYLPDLAARHGIHLAVQRVRVEPFESRLRLLDVRIGTAGGTGTEWSSIETRVDLEALFSGRVVLDDVRMSDARFYHGGPSDDAAGADGIETPAALAEGLDVGEFTIEKVELAAISEALGRPVAIDRLWLGSLADLFRPEGTAVKATLLIGEGRSQVDGRLSSSESGWILDASIDTEGVPLDGFAAMFGVDGQWRGALDGSGPVRFVYSPASDAFSATAAGRWTVDGLEAGFADTVTVRTRADGEGTVFVVLLGDVVDTLSVDATFSLTGLDVVVADAYEAEAAEVTLRIDASQALATRISIEGNSPEVRIRGADGAFGARAGQVSTQAALSFANGTGIEVDRFESGTLAAKLRGGGSVDVSRLKLERAVFDQGARTLSGATATARRIDWRDFTVPQGTGSATGIAVRGIERSSEGGIRLARVAVDTVDAGGVGPALRMHDVVLESTTVSSTGGLAFDGVQASDTWLTNRESTLVLERTSLDGIELEPGGGAVRVRSGRADVVDHTAAAGGAMVGKEAEFAGARVSGDSWGATGIRFRHIDLAAGDASYTLSEFALSDAAGEGWTGRAGLAEIGGIEHWFDGNRVVVQDLNADSPAWRDGAGSAGDIGIASLTLDVMGQSSWQVDGGRLVGVEAEVSGSARADAASIERLTMVAADETIIGVHNFDCDGLTFDGESTLQASSATAGRARFRVRSDASVDTTGLRVDALEWIGESLAAQRGEAPLMSVGAAPVRASLDEVVFTYARVGARGLRQLDSLRAASFRGGVASGIGFQWAAGESGLAGYHAPDAGAATLDLVESREVEVMAGEDQARLGMEKLSVRNARLDPSGDTILASASVDGATLDSPNGNRMSADALEGSGVALRSAGLEIGSLDLFGLDGTIGMTETGEWNVPSLPLVASDAGSKYSVRIGEADTADQETVIHVVDQTTDPDFTARLAIESATLRGFHSAATGAPSRFSIESTADAFTSARVEGVVIPTPTGTDLDMNVQLRGLSLPALSPYGRLHLGQDISAGHADATIAFTVRSSDLDGVVDFHPSGLQFQDPASPENRSLLGTALSLIEEQQGAIELRAPLRGRVDDSDFNLDRLLTRALADTVLDAADGLEKAE